MELPDHEIAGYTEKAPKRKKMKIVRREGKYIVKKEVSPPGRKHQVKGIKKDIASGEIDKDTNPWAITWAQYKKHGKPKKKSKNK